MKIINLYGGPCSGKSTVMAGTFWLMKVLGLNVEMATEYCKDAVYSGDSWPFKDQQYVFAHMRKKIKQCEGKHVDYIVTDSPLLMSHVYGADELKTFHDLVDDEYSRMDNANYLLLRSFPYSSVGRRHSAKSSREVHEQIAAMLKRKGLHVQCVVANELAPSIILKSLGIEIPENLIVRSTV